LGLNNKLLKEREGGESGNSKKSSIFFCNYLLGIIYKLLEDEGMGRRSFQKKIKKVQKKGSKKGSKKRSNKSLTKRFK
jgi:hypothetical protein